MQKAMFSRIVAADGPGIAAAAEVIRRGGLVAFPTETVYGLGGNATCDEAVAAIFAVKDRPRINPLIVHVPDRELAAEYVVFSDAARALADACWPGPLTLVLPRQKTSRISLLASAGLDTLAVRVPSHPVAQALLRSCDLPLAAPSANPSGQISPTTAQHVASDLGDRVELILDGGPVPIGIESTVVGFEGDRPVLLRAGAIARETIEGVVGPLAAPRGGTITSPGQLKRHYAPNTPLRLNARHVESGEALLAFGSPELPEPCAVRNLSPSGDLVEAAANLFAMLRELDATGSAAIAVMPVPGDGMGEAINDRLQRAAARDD